jgi:hypothetical protein
VGLHVPRTLRSCKQRELDGRDCSMNVRDEMCSGVPEDGRECRNM